MTDSEKKTRIFKVLSVSTWVRMIELLKKRSFCVNALAYILRYKPTEHTPELDRIERVNGNEDRKF